MFRSTAIMFFPKGTTAKTMIAGTMTTMAASRKTHRSAALGMMSSLPKSFSTSSTVWNNPGALPVRP